LLRAHGAKAGLFVVYKGFRGKGFALCCALRVSFFPLPAPKKTKKN